MTENWIKWRGDRVSPVGPSRRVITKLRDGTVMPSYPAEGIIWQHFDQSTDVVEYQIVP